MNRQVVINALVGAAMGQAAAYLFVAGHPGYAVLIFVAWIVGLVNSLIPTRR